MYGMVAAQREGMGFLAFKLVVIIPANINPVERSGKILAFVRNLIFSSGNDDYGKQYEQKYRARYIVSRDLARRKIHLFQEKSIVRPLL